MVIAERPTTPKEEDDPPHLLPRRQPGHQLPDDLEAALEPVAAPLQPRGAVR